MKSSHRDEENKGEREARDCSQSPARRGSTENQHGRTHLMRESNVMNRICGQAEGQTICGCAQF